MFKTDQWHSTMGLHFARLFEAWLTCMFAHRPAHVVFTDDLTPDALTKYQAVVLVDQRYEPESKLRDALDRAKAAGVKIFHDGTCRASLVKQYIPLGVKFDHISEDRAQAGDDAAYVRFLDDIRENLPAFNKAMVSAQVAPTARLDDEQVFVTRRSSGQGRYLFVVNHTRLPVGLGYTWRITLQCATTMPKVVSVGLTKPAAAVYDVFAQRRLTPKDGKVEVDLRSLLARVLAILPAPIAKVDLRVAQKVASGEAFQWTAHVLDKQGRPIQASIPLHVSLLDGHDRVLDERYTAASADGTSGAFVIPRGIDPTHVSVRATELISGQSATQTLGSTQAAHDNVQRPADQRFGPHVRAIALAGDGDTAVLSTMNWNHNLYAVNVKTGKLEWRRRLGDYFTFSPHTAGDGFVVQAYDLNLPEGYALYLGDAQGKFSRRFALFGLPNRLPHRITPALLLDRIDNFAAAPSGSWIASSGDLGLAVWSSDGRRHWSMRWPMDDRSPARLAALNEHTLLAVRGMTLTAYDAADGKKQWSCQVARTGQARSIRVAKSGKLIAVLGDPEAPGVYLVRGGKVVRRITTGQPHDAAVADDGSWLVTVEDNQLRFYDAQRGLQWSFAGDATLRMPRIAPDQHRIAVASDLGTLYVLDKDGRLLHQADLDALPVPQWLPGGDLLVATWMGRVMRLGADYQPKWRIHLEPEARDVHPFLQSNATPTVRMTGWTNASPHPLPLSNNLLDPNTAYIYFDDKSRPSVRLTHPAELLMDGSAKPPKTPWLSWTNIGWFSKGSAPEYLVIQSWRDLWRINAITLVEDPNHPESWLRETPLEYWDAHQRVWKRAAVLLSNAATHTHVLPRPIVTGRLRLEMPGGLPGNLRLGEIVLHGKAVGPLNPNLRLKRGAAVLLDENPRLASLLVHGHFVADEQAFHGTHRLVVRAGEFVYPAWHKGVGGTLPGWHFPIVENPSPGQYRYLSFAWRADDKTTGLMLEITGTGGKTSYVDFVAGQVKTDAGAVVHRVASHPPTQWRQVHVDLYKLMGGPFTINGLRARAVGGEASIDQVVLTREPHA